MRAGPVRARAPHRGDYMHNAAKVQELRRATNPLFNDRKLKLGTFCTNLNGAATMRRECDVVPPP